MELCQVTAMTQTGNSSTYRFLEKRFYTSLSVNSSAGTEVWNSYIVVSLTCNFGYIGQLMSYISCPYFQFQDEDGLCLSVLFELKLEFLKYGTHFRQTNTKLYLNIGLKKLALPISELAVVVVPNLMAQMWVKLVPLWAVLIVQVSPSTKSRFYESRTHPLSHRCSTTQKSCRICLKDQIK